MIAAAVARLTNESENDSFARLGLGTQTFVKRESLGGDGVEFRERRGTGGRRVSEPGRKDEMTATLELRANLRSSSADPRAKSTIDAPFRARGSKGERG